MDLENYDLPLKTRSKAIRKHKSKKYIRKLQIMSKTDIKKLNKRNVRTEKLRSNYINKYRNNS